MCFLARIILNKKRNTVCEICLNLLFHNKLIIVYVVYTVFQKKTSTHIIGYKLKNSCLILIIFDNKIPHIM